MNARRLLRAAATGALAAGLLSSCGLTDEGRVAAADAARAKAQRDWKVKFEGEGADADLALERMDVYLVEDDDEYPEIFEIHGADVVLVGEFPMDLHVGYGEAFEKLVGRAIPVRASGGDPREPKSSFVRLGGSNVPVTGGTFTIEKLTGTWNGSEGDKTCWGTLELRVAGPAGERTVRGRFAVNYCAWG
jgi:hypothetical protein